jgi:long-chain fatty acid transport protein
VKRAAVIVLGLLVLWDAQRALAVDGLQFIGFSAESTALGGAGHVAIADTSSINTNPAAMSLIRGARLDVSAGEVQVFLHHSDVFGNRDVAGEPDATIMGGFGFVTRLSALPQLTIGAGLFTQGGFGTKFRSLNTAFGSRDDTSSFLRYLRLAAGVSYEVTDKLSIGVAPSVGYSDITLRLFPHTSVAPSPGLPGGFAGLDIHDGCSRNAGLGVPGDECPFDVAFSAKVGAMYRALPRLTVGATYTSPATFKYRDGRATLNFSAFGLGKVDYDARVSGITWPQQVDVSMAARPTEQLLVALTTSWIEWSAIEDVDVTLTGPRNSLAPSHVKLRIPFDWKDQFVLAVGAAYTAMREPAWRDPDRLVLRAGYNHATNQIPRRTLNPLAPVMLEDHVTAGIGFRFTERWALDAGAIYAFKKSVTYTNSSLPFGPNATESISAYYVYHTLSYRF